jgi:unsaturated chondroitin disaccharide hydrolase
MKFPLQIILIFSFAFSQNILGNGHLDSLVNNAIKISLVHLERSIEEVGSDTLYPSYGTKELKWKLTGRHEWTSGFYAGCLWNAYELSGDPRFEEWARQWTESLEEEKYNSETHDLGFKFGCSFGNGFRLGKGERYNKYKGVLLTTAKTLAERYDSAIGSLSSNWDVVKIENSYPVIIDIMMNLELLFWASENGGPAYYKDYAISHAINTFRDFVRPDGSTYHIVRYNKNTGEIINKGTIQGAGTETTWARGHAWGTYGMVVVYRYTGNKRFLDYAKKLADYFINNLPEDHVAFWDFQSDIKYKDVSSTSIVTSALFEMINYIDDDSLKKHYRAAAESMLESLCSEQYFLGNKETNCLLDHAVQHLPANSNIDVPSIFSDYYFLEAIIRYKALANK